MSMPESCEAVEPLLALYSEPESAAAMAPADRARVSAHLAVCDACRRQAGACRAAHTALRARAAELSAGAPASLAARCRSMAHHTARPRRVATWAGWSAVGAAAAVILFIFLMPANAVATQLAVDHMACSKRGARFVASGTPGEMEGAWLAEHGQQVIIPTGSAANGLRFIGVRRCASSAGKMAHVMYDRHGSPVSLFIFGTTREAPGGRTLRTMGHKAILWKAGANTYALVGRGSDLAETAALMQQHTTNRGR